MNNTKEKLITIGYYLLIWGASCAGFFAIIREALERKKFFSEFERAMSVPEDVQYALMAGLILMFVVAAVGAMISAVFHYAIVKNVFPKFYAKVNK